MCCRVYAIATNISLTEHVHVHVRVCSLVWKSSSTAHVIALHDLCTVCV